MKTIAYPCCLPGCVDGCVHRLPDTIRIEHHSYKTNPSLWHCAEPFDVELTIPHCAKEQERAQWRTDLFAQSDVALEEVDRAEYKTTRGWIRACHNATEPFTRLWWDGPCPFYLQTESPHHQDKDCDGQPVHL